jgi:hypothetical protein
MLSKCANPACSARFRYLHEGRIFSVIFDGQTGATRGPDVLWEAPRRVERYWLCDTCSPTMTLVLSKGRVVLQPMPLSPRRAPASEFLAA